MKQKVSEVSEVSVTVDEEMFRKFKGKAEFWFGERFRPGVTVSLGDPGWRHSSSGLCLFKDAVGGGSSSESQYDEEFTEWLKEHRPEVFL